MNSWYRILISAFFLICFFTSCKQRGCTDKNAVNFNVTADEDDGTCIVCTNVETQIDSVHIDLKDKKFSSPHYNENVARFYLSQYVETPNDKACGAEKCKIKLTIKSLANQTMYFSYYISRYSGPVSISYSNDITINPSESVLVGTITTLNNPPFLSISLDSVSVTSGDIIYY